MPSRPWPTGTAGSSSTPPTSGTRVVKAFNSLYGRVTRQDPQYEAGRLIVFLAGDDSEAKTIVSTFIDSMGFAPVDLGELRMGRLMQVGTGPLTGLHALRLE